jgi:hypothetical protein
MFFRLSSLCANSSFRSIMSSLQPPQSLPPSERHTVPTQQSSQVHREALLQRVIGHVSTAGEEVILFESPFHDDDLHGYEREEQIWERACGMAGTDSGECSKPPPGSVQLGKVRKSMNHCRHLLVFQAKDTLLRSLRNIEGRQAIATKVRWLLYKDRYTCPKSTAEELNNRFQGELLINLVWDRLFSGARQRGRKNVQLLELINGTFLCVLATALHHALYEWRSGVHENTGQFRESNPTVLAVYKRHWNTWHSFTIPLQNAIIDSFKAKIKKGLVSCGFILTEEPTEGFTEADPEEAVTRLLREVHQIRVTIDDILTFGSRRSRRGRRSRFLRQLESEDGEDEMNVDAVAN